jgi:hypothetical protein
MTLIEIKEAIRQILQLAVRAMRQELVRYEGDAPIDYLRALLFVS